MSRKGVLKALITLVFGAGIFVAGCDFARIDEGASNSTEDLVASLQSATSSSDAERAIQRILNKAEIGLKGRVTLDQGVYDGYELSDKELKLIAAEQAEYVGGKATYGATIQEVFDATLQAQQEGDAAMKKTPLTPVLPLQIIATLDEVLSVYRANVTAALATPDYSRNALVLSASGIRPSRGEGSVEISPQTRLSPAEQLLFRIWLHRNGPYVLPYNSPELLAQLEAAGKNQWSFFPGCPEYPDPCCGGKGKFVSITLQWLGTSAKTIKADVVVPKSKAVSGVFNGVVQPLALFTVDGSALVRNSGFSGTIGNELALYVNGTQKAQIHTSCSVPVLPGEVYGMGTPVSPSKGYFRVISVVTGGGGLCSDLLNCVEAVTRRYNTCMQAAGSDATKKAACLAEFKLNDQRCHDQGTSTHTK